MSLSVGIVGFPNVGKSTLFWLLTKKEVACENYPFCTIDPNIGVVSVFDKRVNQIAKIAKSQKKIYPTIKFIDIAGLVKGASKGEGLGNKFLANIKEVDVIIYVLRAFEDKNIASMLDETNPLKEMELIDTELILKDLEVIEKRIDLLKKETRSLKEESFLELNALKKAKDYLERGSFLIKENFPKKEKQFILSCQFLTMKPVVYLLNGKKEEADLKIKEKTEQEDFLIMDFSKEQEFTEQNLEEKSFLNLSDESVINKLIKKSYNLLGYITFFTVNETETRAWKIKKGAKAPEAGKVIHSDFEKGFIKAEVINWENLVNQGSFLEAKKKGLVKTQGKDYVVLDGDIIEIKFRKN